MDKFENSCTPCGKSSTKSKSAEFAKELDPKAKKEESCCESGDC